MKLWYSLLFLLVLIFVGGCVSPSSESLPPHYAENKYPVLAAIHGIKKTIVAADLHNIITTYTPTNEIQLSTNTIHAWLVQIKRTEKPIQVKEVFILPSRARWGTKERPVLGMVVNEQKTCITKWTAGKGTEYVGNSWGMFSDDPLGEYRIVIFFDEKLAAEFKFNVFAESRAPTSQK